MADDDNASIMLFSEGKFDDIDIRSELALEADCLNPNIFLVSRLDCVNALDKVLKGISYEKEIKVTVKVCGACSRYLVGASFCEQCRCRGCSLWKTSCKCDRRNYNRQKIFAWMKNGFYQHTKETKHALTTHCLLCTAKLSMLTAPYMRCMSCLAKTL